ncbi:MAG: GHKL domain-containing protein [Candidatus Scalindua sp.]|jgi:PAS domain S-box-containing protein|nr:GHKL domain-containing protein [Candidatus Scalindua sp.]MBT5306791.1 GHKL domain-containing protein [Candidatus Scalindua sp.]MBT6048805.1 GHKL domain-containing protein [Candidatus Scalindua sp.]MBT6227031.1 GHKL domain-containing protein [Candidatus Scalindua sp.]MBT6563118.1 GHKL domain-containing protein [Candidatus Scalindua sp.]
MDKISNVSELESTRRTVKFFEGLLRSTPNGVVVTDASQNIVLVNGRFSSFFRQHWRDVIETNLFVWLQQLDNGSVDLWAKLVDSVYRDGYCYDVNFNITLTKGVRHLSVNASLVAQESTEDQGIIISNWRDITKQVHMEEQIAASERLAVLGKLAGSIAHEIRNPLATIDISALNLKRKLEGADEKTKSQINRIIKQVKETVDTIQSLQDLSKLEAPNKRRWDISDIIGNGIGLSKSPQSVHFINSMTKNELFVDVDEKQISIVLRNILSNAVHAMDNQGTIWIVAYKEEDGNIVISIRDSGHGITAEDVNKIFQSFYGTKVKGFGYGLTICRMIMEKHGGTIDAVSEEGKGATFILRFPSADTEH